MAFEKRKDLLNEPKNPLAPAPVPETDADDIGPVTVTELDDGGIEVSFGEDDQKEEAGLPFEAEFSGDLDEDQRRELADEIKKAFDDDERSREGWMKTYISGLDQLGLKIEEVSSPWSGACAATHPLLMEAIVEFQAQAITELFPAEGPAKAKVVGKKDEDKLKQAIRVTNYLNFLCTERMVEYRSETERMLFVLAMSGCAFKKLYYDEDMGRPMSKLVKPEELVVSFGETDIDACTRVSHVMHKTENWVRKQMASGFYRKVDDIGGSNSSYNDNELKIQKVTGHEYVVQDSKVSKDSPVKLIEAHLDLDLSELDYTDPYCSASYAVPYIATIDYDTCELIGLRRNWEKDDPKYRKIQYFVRYEYIPGTGFYGFGLTHLIGGLAKASTSMMRQLVDSGTLSNLPGGFKTRGFNILSDDHPVAPGEWRDVDIPGGKIQDNMMPLPYKEPSQVLMAMMQNMITEARRFAAVAEVKPTDLNSEAPVGTTLALIERSMKVVSSVQARIHASMKRELGILARIVKDYDDLEYPYESEDDGSVVKEDFSDAIDVIPVSNPNAATMSQRIMQHQAALQLAQTNPQDYDLPKLHRRMLRALGLDEIDEILPNKEEVPPTDPVSENMALLTSKPTKAHYYQDHDAHIAVHMAALQDPKLLELAGQSPNAPAIQGAFAAHVVEHLALKYRKEVEKELGTQLPPLGEPLPPEVEVRISSLVQQAAAQLLERNKQAVQQEKAQEIAEDPYYQLEKREQDRKDLETQQEHERESRALDIKEQDMHIDDENYDLDRASRERVAGAQIGARVGGEAQRRTAETSAREDRLREQGAQTAVKIAQAIEKRMRDKGKQ